MKNILRRFLMVLFVLCFGFTFAIPIVFNVVEWLFTGKTRCTDKYIGFCDRVYNKLNPDK